VTDCFDTDLSRVIRSSQPLSDSHVKYLLWQILCGVKYLHSGCVVHGQLTPHAIMVNGNCDLRIQNLGLSQRHYERPSRCADPYATVVNWWYLPPEMLVQDCTTKGSAEDARSNYNPEPSIDLWAVGNILAEMHARKPAFRAGCVDAFDVLKRQVGMVGVPAAADLTHLPETAQVKWLKALDPHAVLPGLPAAFGQAPVPALQMLGSLWQFSPSKRPTASQALAHPYLAKFSDDDGQMHTLHESVYEPACSEAFDWHSAFVDGLSLSLCQGVLIG